MRHSSEVRFTETEKAVLIRLLGKAHAEGTKLYQDPSDGRHYASSTSDPSKLHYVTAYSCDCTGFFHHGRCKHHAALLESLGWLSLPTPDPEPGAKLEVIHVAGTWRERGWLVGNGHVEWSQPQTSLKVDGDEKVRIAGEGDELLVWWIENGAPIDAMTDCTPAGADHWTAVRHWAVLLGNGEDPDALLKRAGLTNPAEHRDQAWEISELIAA